MIFHDDIHIPGIDVGGGWITGCGDHHIVQSGWKNWKRVSGVLSDRKMNVKIKGKVYMTVPVYGAETWQEK